MFYRSTHLCLADEGVRKPSKGKETLWEPGLCLSKEGRKSNWKVVAYGSSLLLLAFTTGTASLQRR